MVSEKPSVNEAIEMASVDKVTEKAGWSSRRRNRAAKNVNVEKRGRSDSWSAAEDAATEETAARRSRGRPQQQPRRQPAGAAAATEDALDVLEEENFDGDSDDITSVATSGGGASSAAEKGRKNEKTAEEDDDEDEDDDDELRDNIGKPVTKHDLLRFSSVGATSTASSVSGTSTSTSGGRRHSLMKQDSRYGMRFNRELEEAEDHYQRYQIRRKSTAIEAQTKKKGPTEEEQYDFFTKTWDDEPAAAVEERPQVAAEIEASAENQGMGGEVREEERKLLTKEVVGLRFSSEWNLTEEATPQVVSSSAAKEREAEVYFRPSSRPAEMDRKLDASSAGGRARFFEEEGLYVGERPAVSKGARNKAENRILRETSNISADERPVWFGFDGRLIALPNPLARNPARPPAYNSDTQIPDPADYQPELETVYCEPTIPGPDGQPAGTADLPGRVFNTGRKGLTQCQLEVDISSVVFDHHHLFSLEHYLANQLTEKYSRYQQAISRQAKLSLDRRLQSLYVAVEDLREKLSICVQKQERDFQIHRLDSYRREIRLVRDQRDEESLREREFVKDILVVWRKLKEARSRQNYRNTSVRLVIRKGTMNLSLEQEQWDKELQRELEDAREEHEKNLEEESRAYEKRLNEWKELMNKRKEARRRINARKKDIERGLGSADMSEMAEDEALLESEPGDKPEPPRPFDEEKVKSDLELRAKKCRRPPGETKLTLSLQNQGTLTDDGGSSVQDNLELSRRQATSKAKIFVKLFFNGKEVCQSSSKPISDDFVVPFGHIFPLRIVQWPESLKLQIFEGSTLRTTLLAEVPLPLVDSKTTLDKTRAEPVSFQSSNRVKHDHRGVGSMVEFSANIEGSETRSEPTRGKVFVRIGWAKTSDGVVLAPPPEQWSPPQTNSSDPLRDVMDPDGRIDPAKLEVWMTRNLIDPKDPANLELMRRVTDASISHRANGSIEEDKLGNDKASSQLKLLLTGGGSGGPGGHFRLDDYQDQFVVSTEAEVESNVRYRMLQLRKEKVAEFASMKMIPITEKEIPRNIVEAMMKKPSSSTALRAAPATDTAIGTALQHLLRTGGDPLRSRFRLNLERIRTDVNRRFSIARHRKRHEDVVEEISLDATRGTIEFMCCANASRPLKPVRTQRSTVTVKDVDEISILVSVVRAYDVPVRRDLEQGGSVVAGSGESVRVASAGGGGAGAGQGGPREAMVHSYIEARFQGHSVRTSTAAGPNPTWNQQLELKVKSPANKDFSSSAMSHVRDQLHLHLFDEVAVDLLDDESERPSTVHQRLEKKWLGSLTVPFASLYHNTRIEGTFRLHSPQVLLGYERTRQLATAAAGKDVIATNVKGKDATYVNLYMTIEPPLKVPEPAREKLECDESDEVVKRCQKWKEEMEWRFPNRKVDPMVIYTTGKSVLLTRYFRAILPPKDLVDATAAAGDAKTPVDKVAWFISLIPYLPSRSMFPGLPEIWPNCEEFMSMLAGCEVDHALLLANYFTSLGKRAYLVLGRGVPEGGTAYVLTVEDNGAQILWNSVTGERFDAMENFCPLTAVVAVANEKNIWGNVQSAERWDFTATSDWLPLFTSGVPNPNLPSVQPTQLQLSTSDERAAKILKERIEKTLRASLMHLRKKMGLRTTMNFQGNSVLKKLLPGLEARRGGLADEGGGLAPVSDGTELDRLSKSHKVCGFPLHFAYRDTEQLLEAMHATGVHLNREPGVEFALAVHVEPYPNTVMSVWVYVASMVRKR